MGKEGRQLFRAGTWKRKLRGLAAGRRRSAEGAPALVRISRALVVLVVFIGGCSRAGVDEGIFFPRWSSDDRPTAIVSGVLVERDGCLLLRSGEIESLALWEDGYGFEDGSLIAPSGEPVAEVGATIHGGGGYGSDRAWAEDLVGEAIPVRCIPDGVEPFAMIYDVEPGPAG